MDIGLALAIAVVVQLKEITCSGSLFFSSVGRFFSTMPYVLAVFLYCMRVFNTNFRKFSVFPSAIAHI